MANKTKITVNRSAKSGQFVTKSYSDKHKATTEKETYKVPKKK